MSLSRDEIRDTAACPECRAPIGKPCRHRGKGAAKKNAAGSSHHRRQVIAQKIVKDASLKGPRATVITDASYCPNTGAGGWAAWVRVDGVDAAHRQSGPLRVSPNHPAEAEMMAALNGIHIARKLGAKSVLVQTDCLLVVMLIQGLVKKRGKRDLWHRFVAAAGVDLVGISARHVRGHTTRDEARYHVNRWCDASAKAHMRKLRKEMETENAVS